MGEEKAEFLRRFASFPRAINAQNIVGGREELNFLLKHKMGRQQSCSDDSFYSFSEAVVEELGSSEGLEAASFVVCVDLNKGYNTVNGRLRNQDVMLVPQCKKCQYWRSLMATEDMIAEKWDDESRGHVSSPRERRIVKAESSFIRLEK